MSINPQEDGITHTNIYSKGKTEIGRFLSNFTEFNFDCEDGNFNSIEGYWYWLSTKDDRLRKLSGWKAKHLGRELRGDDWNNSEEFKIKIKAAIKIKLDYANKELSTIVLPIKHYYVFYKDGKNIIVEPNDGKWIIDYIESYIRDKNDTNSNT